MFSFALHNNGDINMPESDMPLFYLFCLLLNIDDVCSLQMQPAEDAAPEMRRSY